MKYQESLVCSWKEAYEHIIEVAQSLFQNSLTVESARVEIPLNKELEYKVKYENDQYDGSFSVKIAWVNAEYEAEEED